MRINERTSVRHLEVSGENHQINTNKYNRASWWKCKIRSKVRKEHLRRPGRMLMKPLRDLEVEFPRCSPIIEMDCLLFQSVQCTLKSGPGMEEMRRKTLRPL